MTRSRVIAWTAAAALAIAGLIAFTGLPFPGASGVTKGTAAAAGLITPGDALEAARSGRILLIDIRTPSEWRATGLPEGAVRSDWWQSGGREKFLLDILALTGSDKNRPIALICARGGRSSNALRYLSDQGFTAVHDVSEGMLGSRSGPGWLARKLPTTPCASC